MMLRQIPTFFRNIRLGRLTSSFVLLVCLGSVVAAETPARPDSGPNPGLIWNRSGLPAVFPLQVKTLAGRDFALTLVNKDTGLEALAAYIVGGAFFKVLVPPGRYILRFTYGDVWQGEERLFGGDAGVGMFELEQPLVFAVRGRGTKAGHLVDLTDMQEDEILQARVKGQFICQAVRVERFPPLEAGFGSDFRNRNEIESPGRRSALAENRMPGSAQNPERQVLHLFYLRYEIRSRHCD